ncbi:MAG: peptidylprolyl isomerase [Patescibacteria group bacterium]
MGISSIRRISKNLLPGVVVILVVAMVVGGLFLNRSAPQLPDFKYRGASVRVNGIKLRDVDFQKQILSASQQANQARMYGMTFTEEQVREEALQQCISNLVIQSEVKKHKIKVSSEDVTKFFNKWSKQFPTKEERYQFYQMYNIGGDREFRGEIKRYIEEQRLYLALAKKKDIDVKVTDAEVRDEYATVDVSHILIGSQKDDKGELTEGSVPEAEAKAKADEVYAKLKAGGDWDKLAKEYSTDASNKDKGGNLGATKLTDFRQRYDKDFVAAALSLKEGSYSQPVKTQFGYHIIKMVERKTASGPEFRKEAEAIRGQLIYAKFRSDREQFSKWIEARTAEADVTILDPALRAFQLKIKDKWAEAAKFYEKAINQRRHRWDRDIFISAMEVFAHEKLWDKSVKYGRKILKLYKEDMDLNAALGKALYLRGKGADKKKAMAYLKKARSLAGEDTTELGKMVKIYQEIKLTKEAKALQAKIKDIVAKQLAEQERINKEMEEERKKQEEAAKSGQQDVGAAEGSAAPSSTTESTGGQ